MPVFFILEKGGVQDGNVEFVSILAMALVTGAITAVIWTTVFLNSRRNGRILLAVLVFLGGHQIYNSFHFSTSAGLMLLSIYSVFALLAVRRIRTRQTRETPGN